MPPRHPDSNQYRLVNRSSFDSDDVDFESQGLTSGSYVSNSRFTLSKTWLHSTAAWVQVKLKRYFFRKKQGKRLSKGCFWLSRPSISQICKIFATILFAVCCLLVITGIFWPSYANPPKHYQILRNSILDSTIAGRGNLRAQKIFISSSIYDDDGHLTREQWGNAVLGLINILGADNVFLSIYANGNSAKAQNALNEFEKQITCSHNVIYEDSLPIHNVPRITLPDGSQRVKRIAYLAEVRNKALQYINGKTTVRYDKVLFLNDVVFDPIDAAQLLFSTHGDEDGRGSFRAACAVDFINPFKFYDTFATRDLEGYSMGLPFFPWFSSAGRGLSRQDVLSGKDAVRVKSCWGGMVAFDASFFQVPTNSTLPRPTPPKPLHFRAGTDLYWEASECCLIHADLQNLDRAELGKEDVGIYLNPFVRVAYTSATLSWLRLACRFERLFSWPHLWINLLVGLPWDNPRRTEHAGAEVTDKVWIPDSLSSAGGSFEEVARIADGSGYCGIRTLQLIKQLRRKGEKNWETIPVPPA